MKKISFQIKNFKTRSHLDNWTKEKLDNKILEDIQNIIDNNERYEKGEIAPFKDFSFKRIIEDKNFTIFVNDIEFDYENALIAIQI